MNITIYMIDDIRLGERWYLNTSDATCFICEDGYMPRVDKDIHDAIVYDNDMSVHVIEDSRKEIIAWLDTNGLTHKAPILNGRTNNIQCVIKDEKLAAQFLLTFG